MLILVIRVSAALVAKVSPHDGCDGHEPSCLAPFPVYLVDVFERSVGCEFDMMHSTGAVDY